MDFLRSYEPRSPGRRHAISIRSTDLTKSRPLRALTFSKAASSGRNNQGKITVNGRTGGVKWKSRKLESYRKRLALTPNSPNASKNMPCKINNDLPAKVMALEYAPRRTCQLALICYKDGRYEYMLRPRGLKKDAYVYLGASTARASSFTIGTTRPLFLFPLGTVSHNVELKAGSGGKFARSAGTFTQLVSKDSSFVAIKMPSKEIRLIPSSCNATLGEVSNVLQKNRVIGKAGRHRWIGKKPKVRGSAMNPNDHPHGGGEGRCPIGRKSPVTPWGKIVLGPKTRKKNRKSPYCIRPRYSKN